VKYFGKVLNDVVFDPELSLEAKGLYAVICSISGSNGYCFPKKSTLSAYTGRHRSTVYRLLDELEHKGYIERMYDPEINKHTIKVHQ
jgi:DNA-binding MarR family transcriptional regulator